MSFIEIRPPKKAVVVTCFSIVVLSIGIWILAFGVIMRAVGDREQLARRILAGYDDIISQYCKEVVEGPTDRRTWQATVHAVTKSRTRLSN